LPGGGDKLPPPICDRKAGLERLDKNGILSREDMDKERKMKKRNWAEANICTSSSEGVQYGKKPSLNRDRSTTGMQSASNGWEHRLEARCRARTFLGGASGRYRGWHSFETKSGGEESEETLASPSLATLGQAVETETDGMQAEKRRNWTPDFVKRRVSGKKQHSPRRRKY